MFDSGSRAARTMWPRLAAVLLFICALIPTATSAAAPTNKVFDITGTVDCGRGSGQRCELGDTVKIRTTDINGKPLVIEIDISWIKKDLPTLNQDDPIIFEIEEKPGGGYQGLRVVTPDTKKKTEKQDDTAKKDEGPPGNELTLSIDDVTVTQLLDECQQGCGEIDDLLLRVSLHGRVGVVAKFTVTLSAVSTNTVTVAYTTQDDTAEGTDDCDEGGDYLNRTGVLTFNPGQTVKKIYVPICPGNDEENDEQFFVILSNPTNAGFGDPQGIGTILQEED